ncbi:PREDICTED: uncharacterized protein LOC104802863 [Tarenaya hassleriana]|uniref:uncharacterized protein LOC104802863 n=1 Tax=Tarenaya hassleriana TaxID=28532 RepID=UPI00053C3F56|nr:PREDICTED: uncharacterized protein LOC104802863 [Tarenaya hassleriana]
MGRIPSSVLRQELAKLDKGPDSYKTAMRALKSYVKDLDARAIAMFVAQVSEIREIGYKPREFTVSLFEYLACAHGVKIYPHTENIMQVIIRTLAYSAGSFPVQQACSKVVSAIARYGIDLGIPEDKKRSMIHSLCKPLSDSLLDSQGHLAPGAAVCMKALVDCDNWRFASDEMVNTVCQNVAVTLEVTSSEASSHMELVMALAKNNPFIVEAYARLLVHSGLRILDLGVAEGNSQKRLSAIQMLNFLMKNLDPKSMNSELELILQEMEEKCRKEPMHYVKMAAYETMQTVKRLMGEGCSELYSACDSFTGSNSGVENCKRSLSLKENDSYRSGNDGWSVNRKHGSCVDVKAEDEDDLFSGVASGSIVAGSPLVPYADYTEEIHVSPESPRNGYLQRARPCQIPQSHARKADAFDLLNNQSDLNSEFRQVSVFNTNWNSQDGYRKHQQHGFVHDPFHELTENREQTNGTYDSPFNTCNNTGKEPRPDLNSEAKVQSGVAKGRKQSSGKRFLTLGLSFCSIAVAGFASLMWIYVPDDMVMPHPVPT